MGTMDWIIMFADLTPPILISMWSLINLLSPCVARMTFCFLALMFLEIISLTPDKVTIFLLVHPLHLEALDHCWILLQLLLHPLDVVLMPHHDLNSFIFVGL